MAHRPTSRLFLFIGLALFFVLTLTFLRQNSPLSPEARAPGHVDRTIPNVEISDKMLHGAVVTSKMGNETAKAELGRSAWRVLHTMMAQFPDKPSAEQQETLRSFIYLFSRLYPCGECASHFQAHLAKFPPQVSSRSAAAAWACHVHNEVNKMLHKDIFDCSKIGDFYDCGCAHDEGDSEDGGQSSVTNPVKNANDPLSGKAEMSGGAVKKTPDGRQINAQSFPPVEIHPEPATNG
ncbi:thiol oxidase [Histoplasma capsulatum G186AR]|uniref:Sulfhydryl oxidase n=2 Tax=Ajellomyces capsulatus TaxID=5037 RepID=C0NQ92_AJECG|nr:thiol oxidase [Histoplasma capsulatum G186AR]EEH06364.1 thiol oxidase [Histoplasma capsulatum G186AR]KAG5293177.1 thiol oxidase [Histoplasma capsulatum]QSS74627.1 thiol oxidase [Histoplasma capsulatum G186AR]